VIGQKLEGALSSEEVVALRSSREEASMKNLKDVRVAARELSLWSTSVLMVCCLLWLTNNGDVQLDVLRRPPKALPRVEMVQQLPEPGVADSEPIVSTVGLE